MNETYPFPLKPLPYAYEALEPNIDAKTLHFHHDKHLQTYVDNLNYALKNYPEYHSFTLEKLLMENYKLPAAIQKPVKNNGGGVFNHNMYFQNMTPKSTSEPVGELKEAISKAFGSFEEFKTDFKAAGLNVFGSGWTLLTLNKQGELTLSATVNQDTVLPMDLSLILIMDVWEHAYYLQYQNRRAEYIDNFFKVINWEVANERYRAVTFW